MLAFINPTHHYLTDNTTREEAFKVCVFIDTLLPIVDKATICTPADKPKASEDRKNDNTPLTKTPPNIKINLQDGIASWANYSVANYVWSSFRIGIEIDNYNSQRADYISVSLIADLLEGGKWIAKHFVFQGVDKQGEEFRVEANEIKKVFAFVSNDLNNSAQIPMPNINKKTLKLEVITRSGEKIIIPVEENKIING